MRTYVIDENNEEDVKLTQFYIKNMPSDVLMFTEPTTMIVLENSECWLKPDGPVYEFSNVDLNRVMGVMREGNQYRIYAKGILYTWIITDVHDGCYMSVKAIENITECSYDVVNNRPYAIGVIDELVDPAFDRLNNHIIQIPDGTVTSVHGLGNASTRNVGLTVNDVVAGDHTHASIELKYQGYNNIRINYVENPRDGSYYSTIDFYTNNLEVGKYVLISSVQVYYVSDVAVGELDLCIDNAVIDRKYIFRSKGTDLDYVNPSSNVINRAFEEIGEALGETLSSLVEFAALGPIATLFGSFGKKHEEKKYANHDKIYVDLQLMTDITITTEKSYKLTFKTLYDSIVSNAPLVMTGAQIQILKVL